MPNRLTSPNARKWVAYNRWRSGHRKLDQQRRLANSAARRRAVLDGYTVPRAKVPRSKAFAVVTIALHSGERIRFAIHELPWGLTVSPTLAGKRVQQVLLAARRVNPLVS